MRNPDSRQCLDSPALEDDINKPVGVWPCHLQGSNQVKIKTNAEKKFFSPQ